MLFSTSETAESRPPTPGATGNGSHDWIKQPLLGQRLLWIGPIAANQRALGRLVVRRLRDGIQRSLDRADASAPHGVARIQALNTLLHAPTGTSAEQLAASALRAGLPVGAQLRVALHVPSERDIEARRRIASYGALHEAGTVDGLVATIVTVQESRARTIMVASSLSPEQPVNIAVSAPIPSARQLPEAVRQARFIAGLQQQNLLTRSEVQFDDNVHLGAFRLLFDRWGSQDLQRYVESLVGELLREDRRGLLRETLRVYLEHGGAQRPTSERLGIHRNTLTYRMRQIRSVLDIDPDDPRGRLGLHLALLAAELPPAPPPIL